MPKGGPRPKQLSQVDGIDGQAIIAQPVGSNPDEASPAYGSSVKRFYLGPGIFGNISDIALVKVDTAFPDLDGDFETFDFIEGFDDNQRADVSFAGRLATGTELLEVRINIKGDDAALTAPPQFRLTIYVEDGATANPVFDFGLIDAPDILTEYIIDFSVLQQPIGLMRYHVVVEGHVGVGQTVFVSRPFVTEG